MKHFKDGDYVPSYFELAASIYKKYGILELVNKATKKALLWAKKKYFKVSYFYFWFNYKNSDLAKKTPNFIILSY